MQMRRRTDDRAKSEVSLTAERYAAETDPAAREDVLRESLEATPASEISIVDPGEVLTTDDHPDWRREGEPVASMCVGEVEVFGEGHWCHWWQRWQRGEEVHVQGGLAEPEGPLVCVSAGQGPFSIPQPVRS